MAELLLELNRIIQHMIAIHSSAHSYSTSNSFLSQSMRTETINYRTYEDA